MEHDSNFWELFDGKNVSFDSVTYVEICVQVEDLVWVVYSMLCFTFDNRHEYEADNKSNLKKQKYCVKWKQSYFSASSYMPVDSITIEIKFSLCKKNINNSISGRLLKAFFLRWHNIPIDRWSKMLQHNVNFHSASIRC